MRGIPLLCIGACTSVAGPGAFMAPPGHLPKRPPTIAPPPRPSQPAQSQRLSTAWAVSCRSAAGCSRSPFQFAEGGRDLAPLPDAELPAQDVAVRLHRALGDAELEADLAVGEAALDRARDLALPPGEHRPARRVLYLGG